MSRLVRRALIAALLTLLVPAGAHAQVTFSPALDVPNFLPSAQKLLLGRGAWSYFGDARSVTHGSLVFTGWISVEGDVWVAQTDVRTGVTKRRKLYADLGVDDHNNPSLVFWRGRLHAFFSEHSGHVLGDGAKMRYRVSRRPFSIEGGFERVRHVRTNTAGGLGFTYPNPIRAGGRLFLFWRGGDWNPTFSSTTDGRRWTRARTMFRGPATRSNRFRPYAKYAEGPDGSFGMVFSDAHPATYRNSLHYLRYRAGRVYRADGSLVGRLEDAPFTRSEADTVYRYDPSVGRAWPHDIAFDRSGSPVIASTRRLGGGAGTDTFYWTGFNGVRWVDRPLVSAGTRSRTFTSGGITLDHSDPRHVVLSRKVGRWNQIERWDASSDDGDVWTRATLTRKDDGFSMRPVYPRFFRRTGRVVVVYFEGRASSFLRYRTAVRMLVYGE